MIYLDNSATTQPCAGAVLAAREMLEALWHNPSAPYAEAVRVEKRLKEARDTVAGALGAFPGRVVFTGSGTEADSLAILGSASRFRGPSKVLMFVGEHPAVLETRAQLEAMGHTVATIPAREDGTLDLEAFWGLLDGSVRLASIMQVGNETGAVQPIQRAGELLKKASPDALLHVDGVQGFLRVPLALAASPVDLYTVSAHKVHGPKGVGALYVRQGVRLSPRIAGGGQEDGLRSGTENTAGIAAFAAAVRWVMEAADGAPRLRAMKLALLSRLAAEVEGLRVNGPDPAGDAAAPHILNVSFPGVGGEVMLHALEREGVLVGTGAACSSKKRGVSPVFEAMGAPRWAAESAIRVSFGLMNTEDEAQRAADAMVRCYRKYKAYQRR